MSQPEVPPVEPPEASAAVAQSRTGEAARPAARAHAPLIGREDVHFTIGPRVERAAAGQAYERKRGEPIYRPLRVYALDPSASRRDGAIAVLSVPFEALEAGPRGAVLEVVDERKVDLDQLNVLVAQGHDPSPTSPEFRAQMVYAVCSTTYAAFRQALGRHVAWGFDRGGADGKRLRVRPYAEALANAYYDRVRGELRFGYFEASDVVGGRNVPRGRVATCLSHDVVVHEMSHALLDGLRAHFVVPSSPDVLAFHEAFADLVAIFQRFTYADVVRAALRSVRGDLTQRSLLSDIATQFGQTTGRQDALRSALGGPISRYGEVAEPHELGSVMVAAVFQAFSTIVRRKTERYVRLATAGTGVLPPGEMPELLLEMLVKEVRQVASQFLSICIRAIDYCPPVDVQLGEFLRAVITADYDLVPDDPWSYREAWIDGFRAHGIYPPNVTSLAEDELRWGHTSGQVPALGELAFKRLAFEGDPGRPAGAAELRRQARALGALVGTPEYLKAFGCAPKGDPALQGDDLDVPVIESVRSSRRVGPDGQVVFDLVAEITQRRRVRAHAGEPGFDFFGGATVILDPEGAVRYRIGKSVLDDRRLQRQRDFATQTGQHFWARVGQHRVVPEAQLFRLTHERRPAPAPAARAPGAERTAAYGSPNGEHAHTRPE